MSRFQTWKLGTGQRKGESIKGNGSERAGGQAGGGLARKQTIGQAGRQAGGWTRKQAGRQVGRQTSGSPPCIRCSLLPEKLSDKLTHACRKGVLSP